MKAYLSIFAGLFLPFAAFAAQEGTPVYYQSGYVPAGVTNTFNNNPIVGQRISSYQVPRAAAPGAGPVGGVPYGAAGAAATPGGIGLITQPDWVLSLDYARKFANFDFTTGVQSKLKWDDMIINEIGARIEHNFSVRNYDLFAFGEYRYGTVGNGYMSMDYDLKPFDDNDPTVGIFTISAGDLSGKTDYLRVGFGAKNVWDVAGWKISPSIGYEIFHHNLEMSNHIYPNPGIYLPLLNQYGDYIFGDDTGQFFAVPQGVEPPLDTYQVCLSPEDIKVAASGPGGAPLYDANGLVTIPYSPDWGYLPWGVAPGDCIIIGGDGPIIVKGTTHIYNTTWNGVYLGLELEKQMTFTDKLRFYFQVGMPNYYSEGIWPNRIDWQQSPSFIDEGSSGAYSYQAEMEYTYRMSERLQLSLKADTNYFYVGNIGGKLFVAGYTTWAMDANGQYLVDANTGLPILETVEPHTVYIQDSLKHARWQSFGLHLGIKYAF